MEHFNLFKWSIRIAKACHNWLSKVKVKDISEEIQQTILKKSENLRYSFSSYLCYHRSCYRLSDVVLMLQ